MNAIMFTLPAIAQNVPYKTQMSMYVGCLFTVD